MTGEDDAISRKAVIDLFGQIKEEYPRLYTAVEFSIRMLPPVKPQEPKTGHWKIIPFSNNHGEYRPNKYACSECGWEIDLCRGLQQNTGHRLFCEHCGAKMESENARGDKE